MSVENHALNTVHDSFQEHTKTITLTQGLLSESIVNIAKILSACLDNAGTIFWCGNGGSAADSQHIVAELVGRFKKNRRALRSIALTTDTSVLTCVANDYSYDDIFARQVEALGRPGDVLVVISTSGRSENLLRAIRTASTLGVITVALLGKGGGDAKGMVDYPLIVPSDVTARIQEAHILIGHMFCELIEQELDLA